MDQGPESSDAPMGRESPLGSTHRLIWQSTPVDVAVFVSSCRDWDDAEQICQEYMRIFSPNDS